MTDLGVGLVQPLFVAFLIARAYDPAGIPCSFVSFAAVCGAMLAGVSLMTMSAISLDRYVAFHFHLKYHDIVTARRVRAVVFVIWLLGLCLALA